MASVKKRPDGVWRARYRDAAGKEHARHFDRKVDAQAWLDDVTASLVTGRYVDPRAGLMTFAQWWADWSARQVWERTTARAAQQAYDCVTFTDVQMRLLRPSHLEAWVKEMQARPLAPSTIKTRFAYVHAALRAAARDRVLAEDPAERIKLPRVRKAEHAMQIPTSEQVGAAMAATSDHFQPFVAVCAFAGLRLGEAAGLQLADVDFLRRTVRIERQVQGRTPETTYTTAPKYGSERTVHVPEALTTMLARHLEKYGTRGDEQWLLSSEGGNRWVVDSAGHQWRRARAKVEGMDGFTLHDLRHYFASGLIADGCDVVTVQRALGHANASMTLNTYSHLWPSAEDKTRAAAAGLMAAALAPADSVRTSGVS